VNYSIVESKRFTREFDAIEKKFSRAKEVREATDFAIAIDPFRFPQIRNAPPEYRVLSTDNFPGPIPGVPVLDLVYRVDTIKHEVELLAVREIS